MTKVVESRGYKGGIHRWGKGEMESVRIDVVDVKIVRIFDDEYGGYDVENVSPTGDLPKDVGQRKIL